MGRHDQLITVLRVFFLPPEIPCVAAVSSYQDNKSKCIDAYLHTNRCVPNVLLKSSSLVESTNSSCLVSGSGRIHQTLLDKDQTMLFCCVGSRANLTLTVTIQPQLV